MIPIIYKDLEKQELFKSFIEKLNILNIEEDPVEKQSSGISKVFIYKNAVIKYFGESVNIEQEVKIINSIHARFPDQEGIVKMIGFSIPLNIIVYEKLTTIDIKVPESYSSLKQLIKILCDISKSLFLIHLCGFYHGDVSIHNFGMNNEGNYVLFDLETSNEFTEENKSEKKFTDIKQFLENLRVFYKIFPDPLFIIDNILLYMTTGYTKEEIIMVSFLGKMKSRTLTKYSYNNGDFQSFIKWLCDLK